MKTVHLKQKREFKLLCVAAALLIIAASYFVAPPSGLEIKGWHMLSIVVAVLLLFISEALPMTAVCFGIIIAMKYTGVATLPEIMKTSASSAFFFCMAGFGLAAALQNTNLVNILLRSMYRASGKDPRRMISVVCLLTAILSVFTANGVAQIVVLSVVTGVIKAFGDPEPGTSRLAAGLMMAIYVGATTGGLFLPCSNGPNIAIMEMCGMISGQQVSFFQWALFGVPCGLVMLLFSAWRLPRYYRPEELSLQQRADIESVFDQIPDKLGRNDRLYILIMSVMMLLWFASNWIKALDVTTVAMAGVVVMMLPGVDLLTAKGFKQNFSVMNAVVLLCVFPLASGMTSTGAGEWIADKIFSNTAFTSRFALVAVATIAAFLIHCLVPAGTANATLSTTVIVPVLIAGGVPAPAAIMIIGIQAGTGFLFPIEGTWQYTFGTEHYTFSDCLRGNWPITVAGILCCILLIPLLSALYSLLGLI
ncbi:MAG: SLC13 family permease [Oscillospiraceae bacterium]